MPDISPGPDADRLCLELALSQNGVIERGQAVHLGLSRSAIHGRLRTGRWVKLLPRVYCLAGTSPSWLRDLTAASLWAGKQGIISGRAAAGLWQLDGCPEGPIDLLVTGALKSPDPQIVVRRVVRLSRADRTMHRGLSVTTPSRTLLDLAHVLPGEALELAVEDALRRGLTSEARLRWMLNREWRKLAGATALRAFLGTRARRSTDSALEVRLFALLRRAKIQLPERQFEIVSGQRLLGRVDFAYPTQRFAIEAHSFRFHSGRQSWEHDVQRDKDLRRAGWRILYVTYEDITERPAQVIADIRAGLSDMDLFA